MIHATHLGAPDGLPAVLAHCFLGHSGSWAAFVQASNPQPDALAFDLPGHGRSPMPDDPGDFHAMCAGVVAQVVERPALLIGHSFGAASLLRYALHNPEMVLGLVLIEPVFFAAGQNEPEYDPYVATEKPLHDAILAGDLEQAAKHFLSLNVGSPDWEKLPEPVRQLMARQMRLVGAAVEGLFEDSGGLLEPGLMESFTPPVLLINGEKTTGIFHATVRGLAQRLANVRCVEIAGAGHMVPISHPVETARAVDTWRAENGLD